MTQQNTTNAQSAPNMQREMNDSRSNTSKKALVSFFILFLIGVGLLSAVLLVQRNQDLERQALVGGPELFFEPSTKTVTPGSTGNLYDVYIDTKGYQVSGVSIRMQYDVDAITPVSATIVSPFIDLCAASRYCSTTTTDGIISMAVGSGINPLTGAIKIATIVFDSSQESGETLVTFTGETAVSAIGESTNVLGIASTGRICIGNCGAPSGSTPPATSAPSPQASSQPSSTPPYVTSTPPTIPTASPRTIQTPNPRENPREIPIPISSPRVITPSSQPKDPIDPNPRILPEIESDDCQLSFFGRCLFR